MSTWSPAQYGTFLEWRTRPSRDLVARIEVRQPEKIVDLGCGPGNSTAVCAERWPEAAILGLDSSPEMIAEARAMNPRHQWMVSEIGDWIDNGNSGERFDVIFSSAALQWVGRHEDLFPRLLERLTAEGVLAVQMPAYDAAPNRLMRELAADSQWRKWFPSGRAAEWRSHSLEFYYTVLAGRAAQLDLWATDYLQIMPDIASIVEWYTSTGLRPYLRCIADAAERERFLKEFSMLLQPAYPESPAGGVPFSFRRLFVVARGA